MIIHIFLRNYSLAIVPLFSKKHALPLCWFCPFVCIPHCRRRWTHSWPWPCTIHSTGTSTAVSLSTAFRTLLTMGMGSIGVKRDRLHQTFRSLININLLNAINNTKYRLTCCFREEAFEERIVVSQSALNCIYWIFVQATTIYFQFLDRWVKFQ